MKITLGYPSMPAMKLALVAALLMASPLLANANGDKDVTDAYRAIADLTSGQFNDARAPKTGIFNEWAIEVTTFDTGITVPTLYKLLNATAKKMEALWPGKVKTYYHEDQFTYPAWKVVVSFDPPLNDLEVKQIVVAYSQSNDHSVYSFYTSHEDFKAERWVEIANEELSAERLAKESEKLKAQREKERGKDKER